jgi:hypothetical protein
MNDQEPAPPLPYDELRRAIGDDPAAHRELDALLAYLAEGRPDPERIAGHINALRSMHDAEARVANWWDDPVTQRWFKALGDAGL